MRISLIFGAVALLAMVSICSAGEGPPGPGGPPPRADIQYTASGEALPLLPRRFQNHCFWKWGHFYCENHCGAEYQFYYCGEESFGCCHVGYGYCDYHGSLRCRP